MSDPTDRGAIDALLDALWRDYTASTPQAATIHALFAARGETVVNDHVALRTYGVPAVGLAVMARPFERLGWQPRDDYRFADKHLRARYWQHPDPARPKVFISELILDELSPAARATVDALVAQIPPGFGDRADLPWAGRPWQVDHATYQALLAESEYAAWVAAFGFRVNHFTVDVNRLRTFAGLAEVNAFVTASGFRLNDAGGVVKGNPAERLEQSSTRADEIDVALGDGVVRLPSCYYEFAKRYPLPGGELFQGFVPASADKIFESTDVKRS
jgi:2-oxoadipate dioxygenase/decarboxylase